MEAYRKVRAKHSFLEMCKTPELAVEVTLQPIDRFDLDAAIIFSDILLPLEKMGASLKFSDAGGPVIEGPVRSKKDVISSGLCHRRGPSLRGEGHRAGTSRA